MRSSKTKQKAETLHHPAQIVWTVVVAVAVALILFKQTDRGRPSGSTAFSQDQILKPQRLPAATSMR